MKLFVVGQYVSGEKSEVVWDMHGVFDTEEEALKNCNNEERFIGPIGLNEPFPDKRVTWPGCYYPNLEEKPA